MRHWPRHFSKKSVSSIKQPISPNMYIKTMKNFSTLSAEASQKTSSYSIKTKMSYEPGEDSQGAQLCSPSTNDFQSHGICGTSTLLTGHYLLEKCHQRVSIDFEQHHDLISRSTLVSVMPTTILPLKKVRIR